MQKRDSQEWVTHVHKQIFWEQSQVGLYAQLIYINKRLGNDLLNLRILHAILFTRF